MWPDYEPRIGRKSGLSPCSVLATHVIVMRCGNPKSAKLELRSLHFATESPRIFDILRKARDKGSKVEKLRGDLTPSTEAPANPTLLALTRRTSLRATRMTCFQRS